MDIAYDYSGVYNSLSEEAASRMKGLGVSSADANALTKLSFEGIMGQLASIARDSLSSPLKGLVTIIAVLILCSMLSAYKSSLSDDISSTLHTVAALCISCAVAVPAIGFISGTGGVISCSANLFLAYIPVVSVMLATSGKGVSAVSYQASMVAAGQGVARVCSDIILPFMNVFLGVSITSGISGETRLNGFLALISKVTKWLLTFVMTVVGNALSEAFKSVQGSITLLKSGLGIFVIIAIAVTFLPSVMQGLGWSLCIFIGKAVAEALGVDGCAKLLEAIGTVFSTLIAILLCVMSVFIISTAAAFTIGGGGS